MHFSLLVNGTLKWSFNISQGWIGVFLSFNKYSNIVSMELSRKMIYTLVDGGLLTWFMVGPRSGGAIIISHLLSVDDTLIHSRANLDHLWLAIFVFCFEAVSGLTTSLVKSEVDLVGNVINAEGLASTLGSMVCFLPLKYLGLLFWARFKAKFVWNDVIEKIERHLTDWKRMYLSKRGRVTVIKRTLSNLPNYFKSLFPLLVGVGNHLEKLQWDFCVGWHEWRVKISLGLLD